MEAEFRRRQGMQPAYQRSRSTMQLNFGQRKGAPIEQSKEAASASSILKSYQISWGEKREELELWSQNLKTTHAKFTSQAFRRIRAPVAELKDSG